MPEHKVIRARILRQRATASEQQAWKALRILRRHGLPVRRQHPIGKFVVDFAIASRRLVIELDGVFTLFRADLNETPKEIWR